MKKNTTSFIFHTKNGKRGLFQKHFATLACACVDGVGL